MIEEIKKELESKIKELERKNQLRSLEMIEWIKWLLAKLEVKEDVKQEPIKVELKEEVKEEKPATPKKKIVFKKK
mgnify:FL=1